MKRQLELELLEYSQKKLTRIPGVADMIAQHHARALMLPVGYTFIGIREQGGNNHGKLVELIQSTIGGADGESWCMSAVQSVIAIVEKLTERKSPIIASEHCLTVWRESPLECRVAKIPLPGALCIWQHGKSENGHMGIVESYDSENGRMYLLEGNTESGLNSKGEIIRDGGGFYRTNRSIVRTGDMHVVGFLKPFL